ncbi:hypothetical protein BDA96_01G506100 [Sorghum bicolor]|uniref:Uncharacterized protein n=2 Tax=Sorghum bicolor TaxID=4558 RepID=A0A921S6U1_SORBI|nr:uncharacterized protein LOC8081909 isoform X1 [Sorghum bicolor]KAG0552424.1 hypothetical protein BDA96_01G506100 [Sorghum bicolor]KXG39994.1 hypothetical protein SORBI_3001G475000 [Sorghum bicolor]|eukprot:XP_021311000.1 uncharacterized protein LOC8081909 isoform X1 [Sorghum bicolor]
MRCSPLLKQSTNKWELSQLHFFSFKLDVSGKADFAFGVFSHLGAQRAIVFQVKLRHNAESKDFLWVFVMDQDVGALHGDNHAFHIELRRSLVQLVSSQPGEGQSFSAPAIPIVSVNGSCYMIALSKVFRQPNRQHRVIFPDGTTVMLRVEDIRMQGSLAAFSVNKPGELPNRVRFSEQQVSHNQEVYTVNYERMREPSMLVRGRVTHVGQMSFYHDCTPGSFTDLGSPVFNEQRELVGMCYCNHGVIGAINMIRIAEQLSRIKEGTANMSLSQIVQHLEAANQGN